MGFQVESGKGKKNTNVELNLVPFIDLMSMCICFLLITAVWTQVSMIQIGSSIFSKRTEGDPLPEPPKKDIVLRLDINEQGYILGIGPQNLKIPKSSQGYDADQLTNLIKDVKTKYPDKKDATIFILDQIKYDELIKGMDALMTGGFPEIAIATQAE